MDIAEFKEFFTRNTQVSNGTKADQEVGFPVQEKVNNVLKFNRFLSRNFPSENVLRKFVASVLFKLNPEDRATISANGHVRLASDSDAINRVTQAPTSYSTVLQPHQLVEVVLSHDPLTDVFLDTITVGNMTLDRYIRTVSGKSRMIYKPSVSVTIPTNYGIEVIATPTLSDTLVSTDVNGNVAVKTYTRDLGLSTEHTVYQILVAPAAGNTKALETYDGIVRLATDLQVENRTDGIVSTYSAVVRPHQIPEIIATPNGTTDTLINTSTLNNTTVNVYNRTIGGFTRQVYQIVTVDPTITVSAFNKNILSSNTTPTASGALGTTSRSYTLVQATLADKEEVHFESYIEIAPTLDNKSLDFTIDGNSVLSVIVSGGTIAGVKLNVKTIKISNTSIRYEVSVTYYAPSGIVNDNYLIVGTPLTVPTMATNDIVYLLTTGGVAINDTIIDYATIKYYGLY